jgi:dipeptidyl aminopeptidase/acylaminoacyl peptidase
MTQRPRKTRSARGSGRDPYGVGRVTPFLAPLLSMAGLVVVAAATFFALTGQLPFLGSPSANGTSGGGPAGRTPSPSAPPDVNPAIQIPGSLVYVKAGNLWIQSGNAARQLTNTGRDSQPTWSPDGGWVYFIETRETSGRFPAEAVLKRYDLKYPVLTRIHPDGTGRESVLSGLYKTGPGAAYTWFWFILDPAVSPDGTRLAVVSDGPDPTRNDVVLQFVDLGTRQLVSAKLPDNPPLGHQDPAWRPDGSSILYVMNARSGNAGAPAIWRYDTTTKKTTPFTSAGYTAPAWSPDGRYVAAVRTTSLGTDVVVLDAKGAELARVTTDGRSSGPAWSPDGHQLAFLRLSGVTVDLQLATLQRASNGGVSVVKVDPLTTFSGLDGNSRPAWWGPRPTPAASPSPALTASPSPSPS